ncbi:hypothetical protein [uncultured Acidaminococcus sp.]|uniref:hypothetical protein n=1 Tax=Acidaminococcus fermentans TaxID=905 RepID=UPI0027DCA33E|nr:hypothetical protein [uncultured Acidaminococcus sp.]MDY4147579.1 hypothetical protein [Acidaminococcus fermentans]
MFSHKILPTVSLSSRMALSLGLAVLGTGSLLFLFPSPALPDFPSLPALAEAEGRTSEPEIRKPGRLPRRDPFRPLDHPSLPASSKPPVVPAKAHVPAAPAPAASPAPAARRRLLGILEHRGKRKALVALPEGTRLLGPGDPLPSQGIIRQVLPSALVCEDATLAIGEVW